jgi:cell division protein FtsB
MSPARHATAAPRNQPRPTRTPSRPRKVPTRSPIDRVRWDRVGRVALLIVLLVVAGLYVEHALAYLSARSQANEQLSIVNRLRRENAALAQQQQALNDPTAIVRDARALGMVWQGERPYVVTGVPKH